MNNNTVVTDEQSGAQPDEKKTSKKNATVKALIHLVIKLTIVTLVICLSLIFVFGIFRLNGNNMYPALRDGDLCVTYKLEEYHSSDVVAYRVDGQIRFGRVVARVGDTIDGDEQGLLINGSHPHEEVFYPTQITDTVLTLPYTLGEGEFVILNDYRTDLDDSRTYGIVKKDALKGKVIFIFRRRGF